MWGIVPDANCEGHFRVLLRLLHTEARRELWHSLNLAVLSFDELELAANATDRQVWLCCQQQQVALITANRTADDADSLESVIRALNTAQSLLAGALWYLPFVQYQNQRNIRNRVLE